ncbi:beta-ketoacyl synthase N-terminal-like domain-containing protein [Streptomyces flaveolus]|uniref:beta-ketoacyl synthase N-terminal-like domain-containing protein n=1 Tax=Streptomyces flaveolus TaxID=67297 RepID=UPI0033EE01F7
MNATTILERSASATPALVRGRMVAAAPVNIVGAGVFSAAGEGLPALRRALTDPVTARPHDTAGPAPSMDGEPLPPLTVRPITDFDPARWLGGKGLRRLTRTDQLAMAACTAALEGLGEGPGSRHTGMVLGTTVGSAGAQTAFLRDTFVQERPYLVNPSDFPGTLMNSAAGKTAIKHTLTGANATVAGGPVGSVHALRFARTALMAGHVRRMLAGGVEELSVPAAWAWYRSGALRPGASLGEGSAVFALERPDPHTPRSAPVLGRLLACEVGFADPRTARSGPRAVAVRLAQVIRSALLRSGLTAEDVALVSLGAAARRGWSAVELSAVSDVFAEVPRPHWLRTDQVFGETSGASAALQLAAVLARWQDPLTSTDERAAVITSVGPDGSVGALVVTRPPVR